MKRRILWTWAAVIFLTAGGCKKASNPNEEIRAAIQRHLSEGGTLNLAAFDTELKQVTMQGDRAQADVVFHVKDGPGMMQLSYNLEKRNGVWAVQESKPVGSDFTHPALDAGQTAAPGAAGGGGSPVSGALRNFKTQTGAPQGNLPPGHPPIDATAKQPPAKKKP
jgi:hypothetical protein